MSDEADPQPDASPQTTMTSNLSVSTSASFFLPHDGSTMRPVARLRPWKLPPSRVQTRCYASAPTGPPIRAETHPAPHTGNIRLLLLDSPHNRNALSRRFCNDLRRHIDEVKAEGQNGSIRALVIASNVDKVFCAGADLKERKDMSQAEATEFLDGVRDTFTDLQNLPIPTISAVDSFALGGGLELALCTMLRVFGSSAQVGLPETRLAILPGAGGTFRLPAVIGLQRARDLILTGRRVTGAEAYFLGLCDRLIEVTPEEQQEAGRSRTKVLGAGLDLARDICSGGPIAIGAAMHAVHGWQRGDAAMREGYDIILPTEDRMEALRAFAEKRKPVYKGR